MPTPVAGLPVGSVSVSGSDLTVSQLLQNPRIIERRVGEAAAFDYWADRILPNVGGPGGGFVIYEKWSPLYSTMSRKPEPLAPEAEVPLASTQEGDYQVATVEADGLGYTVSREQRNRNQRFVVDRKERALANSIADKFNARAVTTITAAISANSRTNPVFDWSAVVAGGNSPTPKASWPHSQLALLKAQQRQQRIPFTFDGMLAHPLDVWRLATIYQLDSVDLPNLANLGTKLGLPSGIISDNTGLVPHGQPILYASGITGGTVWEEPITAEVIPEPRRRRTVVQMTGTAGYFVDNPYGLLQLTGTAAADITAGLN